MGTTVILLTEGEPRLAGTEQVKHTPGPWSVGRSCDNTPAVIVPCPDSSGFAVAHINRLPKLGLVRGDIDANARLIAAAPDLLAALKASRRIIEFEIAARGPDAQGLMLNALNLADSAIAKAEGRTP